MTTLVDTVKSFSQSTVKGSGNLGDRISESVRRGRKVVVEAQKRDPGSKYLGISGVKGVDSRKKINEREDAMEKQIEIDRIEKENEFNRTHPAPISDTQAEKIQMRKRVASQRRASGRLSTVLSETLG